MGIWENETLNQTKNDFDLPDLKINATVTTECPNYAEKSSEIAKSAKFAELQNLRSEKDGTAYLKQTPYIPSDIFSKLPDILREGCSVFRDDRERNVFLTGALSVLSGCLPKVSGVYAREVIYTNLFCFIVSPPASNKAALKFSKMLADEIHNFIMAKSRSEWEYYLERLQRFKDRRRNRRQSESSIDSPPKKPRWQVLFIPANVSCARLIWHLDQNEGSGVLVETETDTLVVALKQKWGEWSYLIRKSFHHEGVSDSKMTDNKYIEVKMPCLSIALSGTPNQVLGLILSTEDGLFSRFIFYVFEAEPIWKDVSPDSGGLISNEYFEKLSRKVKLLYDFLSENPTTFELSPEQWDRLNRTCAEWLHQVTVFNGDEASSIVKRLGLIMFRIAMILSAIRKFERKDYSLKVLCADSDFDIAIRLSQVYLDHSLFMFNNLPKQDKTIVFNKGNNKQKFYNDLPELFKRSEAIELGKSHGLSERTTDGLLKKLLGKYLHQESFGVYSKNGINIQLSNISHNLPL
jgi:hypothetical protein